MKDLDTISRAIGQAFLPDYPLLTTSDLQACIDAEVAKYHLSKEDARAVADKALEFIYNGA